MTIIKDDKVLKRFFTNNNMAKKGRGMGAGVFKRGGSI